MRNLKMSDLILDTNVLADLLAQYFVLHNRTQPQFLPSKFLSPDAVRFINRVIRSEGKYIIGASVLAVVEIVRKWDDIVKGRFAPYQLAAFLESTPEWFVFEPMEQNIIYWFGKISAHVRMLDDSLLPIEWTDAIHAATALSRDNAILVTTDGRLNRLVEPYTILSM